MALEVKEIKDLLIKRAVTLPLINWILSKMSDKTGEDRDSSTREFANNDACWFILLFYKI